MIKKHRIFGLLVLLMLMLLVCDLRLGWIQWRAEQYGGKNLIARSVMQRQQRLVLDEGRAHFVDRHGIPLTGKRQQGLAIFPAMIHSPEHVASFLSPIVRQSASSIQQQLEAEQEPFLWPASPFRRDTLALTETQIQSLDAAAMPGMEVVSYTQRYISPYLASHLIGRMAQYPERIDKRYTLELEQGRLTRNSQIGVSGLELQWNEEMIGVGSHALVHYQDGQQRPLAGLGSRMVGAAHELYPLRVMLTLDSALQYKLEQTMDDYMKRHQLEVGAAVLLDVQHGEVRAMVSRPMLDPYAAFPDKTAMTNYAVKALVPGSIFKTVIAAYALEHGLLHPKEQFECRGHYGKYGLMCWKKEGHGKITAQEAFAQSCNVAFARIAERIQAEELQAWSEHLGLLTPYGMLPEEEKGRIFLSPVSSGQIDGGELAQAAIGQRNVRISPLQAANWIVTLLNEGKVMKPRAVTSVQFRNETVKRKIEKVKLADSGLSAKTTRILTRWMTAVVEQGTGKSLRHADWALAGKSGTAELGTNGEQGSHEWFIGYGPVPRPRYALAVVVRDEQSNLTHHGTALFGQLFNALAAYDQPDAGRP
ncbi:peptidoglycan D,D-transpeptidase FtsI family protein [Marinicrinis sediminis]|uniref:Peptidoglycan D,D-transpeptidase FtsI family protein n=1 Tax=Marinicrinis sediminis TaxID=1652465 RepID=A0ABW5R7I2_9BACL